MEFKNLEIDNRIKEAILKMGFAQPTEIQARAIPVLLSGADCIGQAQTGTGKTAAFGLPLVEMCSQKNDDIEALVLAPTRELAVQIVDALRDFSSIKRLKIATIIGGISYTRQLDSLRKKPNIVVATPGRIIDYLESKKLTLDKVKFFCIDEADEMLKIGFKEEIDKIISYLPKKKQSALFSATIDEKVRKIADKMMDEPVEVLVSSGLQTIDTIDQYAIMVDEKEKLKVLTDILDVRSEKSLIFGRTKKRADELTTALNTLGYSARALHGDLNQRQRMHVVDEFKKGGFDYLVATDVAARGIDISNIMYVYNFDLPQEIEYYVHRIGRTGRANTKGVSFSFVREVEMDHLKQIEEKTNSTIKVVMPPTREELHISQQAIAVDKLVDGLEVGKKQLKRHLGMGKKLIEEYGAEMILSAAIEVLIDRKPKDLPMLSKEPAVTQRQPRKRSGRRRDRGHRGGDNRGNRGDRRSRGGDNRGSRGGDRGNRRNSEHRGNRSGGDNRSSDRRR